jgi:hypothetical protein
VFAPSAAGLLPCFFQMVLLRFGPLWSGTLSPSTLPPPSPGHPVSPSPVLFYFNIVFPVVCVCEYVWVFSHHLASFPSSFLFLVKRAGYELQPGEAHR